MVRLAKDIIIFLSSPFWLTYLFWRGFSRKSIWEKSPSTSLGKNSPTPSAMPSSPEQPNPLQEYFKQHNSGPGIWKWEHYFDIYHQHFSRFIGKEVHILEIGIYSGGSLEMWKQYFGPRCKVYGVDIMEECRSYESDSVKIFIGNQADRSFWKKFWKEVPRIDIIIDDGGHRTDQQIITLEETLPHLEPGGVFVCEDVHGKTKGFTSYVDGLVHQLTAGELIHNLNDSKRRIVVEAEPFQAAVHSIHSYPFVTVIEKRKAPVREFVAPRHGTSWQPFLQ